MPRKSQKPKKVKPQRVWLGRFKSTALSSGQESTRGYGPPRSKWDPTPAIDREQAALRRAAHSTLNHNRDTISGLK